MAVFEISTARSTSIISAEHNAELSAFLTFRNLKYNETAVNNGSKQSVVNSRPLAHWSQSPKHRETIETIQNDIVALPKCGVQKLTRPPGFL